MSTNAGRRHWRWPASSAAPDGQVEFDSRQRTVTPAQQQQGAFLTAASARQVASTARTGQPVRIGGCRGERSRSGARSGPAACSSTCPREVELARYEHVQRHVTEARYLGDYKIWLEFNDGRKGVVDLADDLYGEHFDVLRDRGRFAEFYLDYGLATIAWHHGVDFAPDYLYEKLSAMH
jgi:hypothetical protein